MSVHFSSLPFFMDLIHKSIHAPSLSPLAPPPPPPPPVLMGQHLADTTLTKVFVGGLAWETQEAALREHFDKCGEILEAVVICDKISGRSKGYGFVTFKEAEAAKKACEEATPVINGRRANCNLASLGAKRGAGGSAFVRPSPPSTPAPFPSHHPPGMAAGSRVVSSGPPAAAWHYPHHPSSGSPPPPSTFQLPHYHGAALPFYATSAYGYCPNYMADLGYTANYKCSNGGGGGGGIGMGMGYFHPPLAFPPPAEGMVPMYTMVYQGMGVPAHFLPPTSAAVVTASATMPTIVSKPPPAVPPPTAGEGRRQQLNA